MYIDTLHLALKNPLSPEHGKSLSRQAGNRLIYENVKFDRLTHHCERPYIIKLQRPRNGELHFLHCACDYALWRVDIALDLVTSTRTDAEAIKGFLDLHLIQPWRAEREIRVKDDGIYWQQRSGTGRGIVLYADREKQPEKVCCHLEVRLDRARSCKQNHFQTLLDLENADLPAILSHQLRFGVLIPSRLEKQIDVMVYEQMRRGGQSRKKARWLVMQYLAHGVLQDQRWGPHQGRDWWERIPAQHWLDRVKEIKLTAADLDQVVERLAVALLLGSIHGKKFNEDASLGTQKGIYRA